MNLPFVDESAASLIRSYSDIVDSETYTFTICDSYDKYLHIARAARVDINISRIKEKKSIRGVLTSFTAKYKTICTTKKKLDMGYVFPRKTVFIVFDNNDRTFLLPSLSSKKIGKGVDITKWWDCYAEVQYTGENDIKNSIWCVVMEEINCMMFIKTAIAGTMFPHLNSEFVMFNLATTSLSNCGLDEYSYTKERLFKYNPDIEHYFGYFKTHYKPLDNSVVKKLFAIEVLTTSNIESIFNKINKMTLENKYIYGDYFIKIDNRIKFQLLYNYPECALSILESTSSTTELLRNLSKYFPHHSVNLMCYGNYGEFEEEERKRTKPTEIVV